MLNDAIESSDEDLVDRYVQDHQQAALDELLHRYLGRVRGLVCGMVCSPADVDDVTQEVFLRAIRALPQFKKKSKFTTWFYRVVINTTVQFLRQRARRPASDSTVLSDQAGRRDEEPDYRALGGEMYEQVAVAMASLPPSLRAAVMLMGIERLSGDEAAAIEGCSAATMYWRIHEARKRLAGPLQRYLEPEDGPSRGSMRRGPC